MYGHNRVGCCYLYRGRTGVRTVPAGVRCIVRLDRLKLAQGIRGSGMGTLRRLACILSAPMPAQSNFKAIFLSVFLASTCIHSCYCQQVAHKQTQPLKHTGTCATIIEGPIGTAFVIDSRITETLGDKVTRQYPGCKVLLARPTILLAGVGLEDTTGSAGRWNSLDEAARLLQTLPENPTEKEFQQWGADWGHTLSMHFRLSKEAKPARGGFRTPSCYSAGWNAQLSQNNRRVGWVVFPHLD